MSALIGCVPPSEEPPVSANAMVMESVAYLYDNYGLLGWGNAVLTHDIIYGPYGTIPATEGGKTMNVAAMMEVILTVMQRYASETGNDEVFDYLPIESWRNLSNDCIKAHIWTNPILDSYGTVDALCHFGMGEIVPFEELTPGSFINFNRTTSTGHAVVFLAFIDGDGTEYAAYPDGVTVIGFKYFSSQGGPAVGEGGLDYRYAIFDGYGPPSGLPHGTDIHVIYSTDRQIMNTGRMLHPSRWEMP